MTDVALEFVQYFPSSHAALPSVTIKTAKKSSGSGIRINRAATEKFNLERFRAVIIRTASIGDHKTVVRLEMYPSKDGLNGPFSIGRMSKDGRQGMFITASRLAADLGLPCDKSFRFPATWHEDTKTLEFTVDKSNV